MDGARPVDVTIYDVAKRAGVSITTVSRVLNQPERVNPETRARVYQAIEVLGFVPRAEAVARARTHVGRIGVLSPFFTFPSFAQRLRAMANTLSESNFELVIYNVNSASNLESYLNTLPILRRLDGIVLLSLNVDNSAIERLRQNGMEIVLLDCWHPQVSSITIDDEAGGRLVAEHLLRQGRRRLAVLGDANVPSYTTNASAARMRGFQSVLAAAGMPPAYHALSPHGISNAVAEAHELLSQHPRPDAIFATSDQQAMGVLKAARERQLLIPEDIAVIGFDDLDMSDVIGLTTVRQPLEESGKLAIELLLNQINEPGRPPRQIRFPLEIISRETG
ncbi:MAG: LacI family DNA-binding transcriptional regulator [Roseiflexaceae bacterium]